MIGRQPGQVMPIFGIMLVFIVGVVSLAVDYGVLSNQHRNLQEFADQAALAGVQQLNPAAASSQVTASQTAARKAAFVYLRENLSGGNGAVQLPISSLSAGSYAGCWGTAANIFSADIRQCALPVPFSAYTVTICTPGETLATGAGCAQQVGQQFDTLSVRVSETVSTTLIRALGVTTETATGYGEAQFSAANSAAGGTGTQAANMPFAIYANGCVTTGNQLEIVKGDVYINQCSLQSQSSGQAGFCIEASSTTAGNLLFGPNATIPVPAPASNQSLSTCLATSGGATNVMGLFSHLAQPVPPPQFLPPPGYSDFDPNGTYAAAQANNLCVNNTVAADGSVPNDCFNPGYYTTVGNIANNLNPGVYYVVGDPSCTASLVTPTCAGVNFSGDTMNANWMDLRDSCWAAPNVPNNGQFTAPCPDGFAIDPTSSGLSDTQCAGATFASIPPPVFTVAASLAPGNLDPSSTGTTYYVRVSALNGFGESATTESSVVVAQGLGQHSLTVVAAAAGASGYRVYVATTSGSELQSGVQVAAGVTAVTDNGSGSAYPRFDTTSCKGFRNIPRSPDPSQNNGVTFVLFNKASFCGNPSCSSPSGKPTVMLSPYCSTYRFNLPVNAPDVAVAAPPGISAGTACAPPYATAGPYMNDGGFAIYGSTQGSFGTAGSGSTLAMVGTVYIPSGSVNVTANAVFELVPGQIIAHDVLIQTGNHQNPSVYYPCCTATSLSTTPVLVSAQQPPRLHLIR